MKIAVFHLAQPQGTISANDGDDVATVTPVSDETKQDIEDFWKGCIDYYLNKSPIDIIRYIAKRQRGYWEVKEIDG